MTLERIAFKQNLMDKANPESTFFGFQDVTPDEKTNRVLGVFDSVATRYDIMNDVMSMGIHRLWKDQFVSHITPQTGNKILDMAGGTGDIAFRMHNATNGEAEITVSDINESMLSVGQGRAYDRGITKNINWIPTNAESLPFKNESFDIYTIAFGLRNVTQIDTALKEACRVLKKGGRFYCLEFSHVDNPLLAKIYGAYSDHLIPKFGKIIANDEDSYQYLIESIRQFPRRDDLKKRLLAAGFSKSIYKTLNFGVVTIHEAVK